MPIRPFLSGQAFDPETIDNMSEVLNLRIPKAFGAWLEVGDERFSSSEIQRLVASLSDRTAHAFATRLMGPPPAAISGQRPPLPDFQIRQ